METILEFLKTTWAAVTQPADIAFYKASIFLVCFVLVAALIGGAGEGDISLFFNVFDALTLSSILILVCTRAARIEQLLQARTENENWWGE